MIFLALYSALCAGGVFLDYLTGLYVETAFGPTVSLMFFLTVMFVVIIGAFPIAMRLSPADKI